jgi:hypothetical protein
MVVQLEVVQQVGAVALADLGHAMPQTRLAPVEMVEEAVPVVEAVTAAAVPAECRSALAS